MTDSTRAPGGATGPFSPIATDAAHLHRALEGVIIALRKLFSFDPSMSHTAVYIAVRDVYRECLTKEETYPGVGELLATFQLLSRMHSSQLIAGCYPRDYEEQAHARLQRRAAEAARTGTHLRLVESV